MPAVKKRVPQKTFQGAEIRIGEGLPIATGLIVEQDQADKAKCHCAKSGPQKPPRRRA